MTRTIWFRALFVVLVLGAATCGVVLVFVGAPVRLDVRLRFDLTTPGGLGSAEFQTVDGKLVPIPRQGFSIYANRRWVAHDRFEVTYDSLLEHGLELPREADLDPPGIEELLRTTFGFQGHWAKSKWNSRPSRLAQLSGAPEVSARVDLYTLQWMWPGALLDSFILVIVKDARIRRGVVLRLRHETGVKLSGMSAQSFVGEPVARGIPVHYQMTPYARPVALPQPQNRQAWQDYGAQGWWIEQFPVGAPLTP